MYKVLTKANETIIIRGVKNTNNFTLLGWVTSIEYFKFDNFYFYKYYIRIHEDTCGLPQGFKTSIVSFNSKIDLVKNERYVFKHLTFNEKHANFTYKHGLSLHYKDFDKPPKEGPHYVKLEQFY